MSLPRVALVLAMLCGGGCGPGGDGPAGPAPAPASLDEFRAAAEQILADTGVPGAGLALIRPDGVEWAGGVGLADRDRGIPVTADTHFRVGSISKTFVAMALVQQYEDGALDIEAPVSELAPQVAIDNPWNRSSPVTLLQLLQHTAGFDDMHFNEMYNVQDPPDLPLEEVLRKNPASRRVRWRPGTRMSYSNPGYAVAAYVLEQVTGQSYEDVIRERILDPLGMHTTSFVLDPDDLPEMARGYDSRTGPPVPFSQIYLRPAGNLHTSAAELAVFVQLLLNWGETADDLVIDPEYLSNMERPRTSLAARAGLYYGYGTGIASRSLAGFAVLGHGGGIEGFSSSYGYAAARDAGWVVLVNATYAPEAVERLSALALQYLKRDIAPSAPVEAPIAPEALAAHEGYYHPEGSRYAVFGVTDWLMGGLSIARAGTELVASPIIGSPGVLVPVSDTIFRRKADVTPSRIFSTDDEGRAVMLGDGFFGVRQPRWRVELIRVPIAFALMAFATVPAALLVWLARVRRARPHGFWALKLTLSLLPAAVVALAALALWAPARDWGTQNAWTRLTFLGSTVLPLASLLALGLVVDAWRRDAGPWLLAYTSAVVMAGLALSALTAAWGLVGLRPWAY